MNQSVTTYLKTKERFRIQNGEEEIERESFTLGADSPVWNARIAANEGLNRTGLSSSKGNEQQPMPAL